MSKRKNDDAYYTEENAKKSRVTLFVLVIAIVLVAALIAGTAVGVVYMKNLAEYKRNIGLWRVLGTVPDYEWDANDPFFLSAYPEVKADADADIKVLLFSDTHFGNDGSFQYNIGTGRKQDEKAYAAIKAAVEEESPHLVVFLGDMIETVNNEDAMHAFCEFAESLEVPWTYTFGNADGADLEEESADKYRLANLLFGEEKRIYTEEEADLLLKMENRLFRYGPTNLAEDTRTIGNTMVNLYRGETHVYTLFTLDSNAYVYDDAADAYLHDGVRPGQVAWYEWAAAGLGGVPHMLMMHMPPTVYQTAYQLSGASGTVSTQEAEYGLWEAAKAAGATHIFAGHDHNQYFGLTHEGVALHYNLKTGRRNHKAGGKNGYKRVVIDTKNEVSVTAVMF